MTYQQKIEVCNNIANWFADTDGVEYFNGSDPILLQQYYSEYLKDSKTDFPELKRFFRKK